MFRSWICLKSNAVFWFWDSNCLHREHNSSIDLKKNLKKNPGNHDSWTEFFQNIDRWNENSVKYFTLNILNKTYTSNKVTLHLLKVNPMMLSENLQKKNHRCTPLILFSKSINYNNSLKKIKLMAKLYIHVNYKYCTIKTYEDWVTLMYPPLIQAFCFMFLYAEMQGIKHLLTKFWMMIFLFQIGVCL